MHIWWMYFNKIQLTFQPQTRHICISVSFAFFVAFSFRAVRFSLLNRSLEFPLFLLFLFRSLRLIDMPVTFWVCLHRTLTSHLPRHPCRNPVGGLVCSACPLASSLAFSPLLWLLLLRLLANITTDMPYRLSKCVWNRENFALSILFFFLLFYQGYIVFVKRQKEWVSGPIN